MPFPSLPTAIAAFLSLAVGFAVADSPDPVELPLDTSRSNQLNIRELGNGEVELTTTGADPWIHLKPFDPAAVTDSHRVLSFDYFSPGGLHGLMVYYGPPVSAENHFGAGSLGVAEGWVSHSINLQALSEGKWNKNFNQLRLDLGQRGGVTLRMRNFRLRPPNEEELRSQREQREDRESKLEREARINAYFKAEFPGRITAVVVSADEVIVRGKTPETARGLKLIEIHPEISIADHAEKSAKGAFILSGATGLREAGAIPSSGEFEIRLPRAVGADDRITSRWAIAEALGEGWKLGSHWSYATDLTKAASHDLPRMEPKGIKGMGGVHSRFPLEELVELGVHNITINIPISNLLSSDPKPNWKPFSCRGRTWYIHPSGLAEADRLASFAHRNGIVASGILLVNFSSSEFAKVLIHPEADRAGVYAMPNLTSPEGVEAYTAVLELLASRYAAPGAPNGRISNWIIHNEVGYGWVWTNMGRQPPMLYMDHLIRSMRLAHDISRRHDPHSRVFLSLTHHWNTQTDPSWKAYSNTALLGRLIESSRLEGDFAWGIAYHPYPQNLRRPDAWNDTRVTDSFDTPLITPKNIAVLDRWMETPEMLDSQGRVRGLLLSEQGFNTPDYSEESQRLQAAGFIYMWRQMRGLKHIEAFHNHRWVDAAEEGGLLLGLRKLAADGKPYGDKKLSWEVYKALDTDAENEVVKEFEKMLE